MGSNLAVNTTDFENEVLKSDLPVLVDFWATWCGPCVAIGPVVEEIATETSGRGKVYKVNVDEEGDLAIKYGVMTIPALLVFKNGQEVDRMFGAAPKDTLKSFFEKHL